MTYMTVQVITPDDIRYDHHANFISVKTPGGEVEILPEYINLIAPFTAYEMKICRTSDDNHVNQMTINGGTIEVKDNFVTIVADSAEHERDIDVSRAERTKIHVERELEQAQGIRDIDEVRRAQVMPRRVLNRISVGSKQS